MMLTLGISLVLIFVAYIAYRNRPTHTHLPGASQGMSMCGRKVSVSSVLSVNEVTCEDCFRIYFENLD